MIRKKNYKHKHFLIISLAIILGGSLFLPFDIPNLVIAQTALICLFCGPYEKIDELVEKNLSIANKYTLLLLLIMLIIFSLLVKNNVTISSNTFSLIVCTAVAIRSILFLGFDGYLNLDKGE